MKNCRLSIVFFCVVWMFVSSCTKDHSDPVVVYTPGVITAKSDSGAFTSTKATARFINGNIYIAGNSKTGNIVLNFEDQVLSGTYDATGHNGFANPISIFYGILLQEQIFLLVTRITE